jgi:hypothetical protein
MATGSARNEPLGKLTIGGTLVKFITPPTDQTAQKLSEYFTANAHLMNSDPGFAAWLKTEYVPIAGGWQY